MPLTNNYSSHNSAGKLILASASWITFAENGDMYISGEGTNKNGDQIAVYWKNGVIDTLPVVTQSTFSLPVSTFANAIVVSGNDVYVGGGQSSIMVGLQQGAILWKNGVPTLFGGLISTVTSLFSSNGNLFLTGTDEVQGRLTASYYRNGKQTVLDSVYTSESYDISNSGNNTYVVGSSHANEVSNATLWKNGVPSILSSNVSNAISVFVSGNDIYVGGLEVINGITFPTIWKNGVATHLSNNSSYAECNQVLVSGSDVYAIGNTYDQSSNSTAVIWKNGVATILAPSGSLCATMYVKPR